MWNILEGWYTNPMSIPNAVRDDYEGYFLEEDIDVATWISKIITDIPREQIYTQIIPYMEWDGEKQPYSATGLEHAAYMQFHQRAPAPNKSKKPLTGSTQSKYSAHAPQPAKNGKSSRQQLDVELDAYSQLHEPALPYDE
ncbi:hypothetical protein M422DRAFT_245725 [Sphaerobolus stellatus SS14]|nr:hypothetical protein M422DRAFT_245725 [Sphaerobolus stellatus SS14]